MWACFYKIVSQREGFQIAHQFLLLSFLLLISSFDRQVLGSSSHLQIVT